MLRNSASWFSPNFLGAIFSEGSSKVFATSNPEFDGWRNISTDRQPIVGKGGGNLLPLILSYLLIRALFDVLSVVTAPIADLLPEGDFPDVWVHRLTAVVVLVLLSLFVGLVGESAMGKRFGHWLERKVLSRFSPYAMLRSFSQRLSGADVPGQLQPALLSVGAGARMVAYIVEEHADGNLTVFVPFAAAPGFGNIQIVAAERVEKIDAPLMETLGCLFNWGSGTGALLKRRKR